MIRSTQVFSTLICLVWATLGLAENKVIGTVVLTLDGEEQTWYVLDAQGDMLPSAIWLALGPEHGTLSIAAYPNPDVGFMRDDATGSAMPDTDIAALVITVGFPIGAAEQTYELPTQAAGPASVLYLPNWKEPLSSYDISTDPGEMRLTTIEADTEALSSFTGSFRGVLRNADDETMVVEDARFEVGQVPFYRPEAPR
jgi:hypothetical protein